MLDCNKEVRGSARVRTGRPAGVSVHPQPVLRSVAVDYCAWLAARVTTCENTSLAIMRSVPSNFWRCFLDGLRLKWPEHGLRAGKSASRRALTKMKRPKMHFVTAWRARLTLQTSRCGVVFEHLVNMAVQTW